MCRKRLCVGRRELLANPVPWRGGAASRAASHEPDRTGTCSEPRTRSAWGKKGPSGRWRGLSGTSLGVMSQTGKSRFGMCGNRGKSEIAIIHSTTKPRSKMGADLRKGRIVIRTRKERHSCAFEEDEIETWLGDRPCRILTPE